MTLLSPCLRSLLIIAGIAFFGAAATGCTSTADSSMEVAEASFEVLVFSKTDGFRHEAIPDGIEALKEMGQEHGFGVRATEDASVFTPDTLSPYAAIIFLNTTEDVLDADQEEALQAYIRDGGGFVGVHAATDTEYEWPWYNQLVGAYFAGHPSVQEATIAVVDATHPSTHMLPDPWEHSDEWYSFKSVQDHIEVLLNLDETSYDLEGAPEMGDDHPVAWYHEFDGGRSWYTALGHTASTYREPMFRAHLWGGIQWAAGAAETPAR